MRRLILILSLLLAAGPAAADSLSGPLRVTLAEESWGTVYYMPGTLKDYQVRTRDNLRLVTSELGEVRIESDGLGDLRIAAPDGELSLDAGPEGVKVTFQDQSYDFLREGQAFLVRYPDEELHHTFGPSQSTIVGKQGTLEVTETNGDYLIASPAGESTYKVLEDGFAVTGAPYKRHPYLYRGALFELSGVGVFVDFKKLTPENSMTQFIDWEPILRFSAGEQ